MQNNKIRNMIIAALMAALTCVATLVIQIPIPFGGYVNVGDALVLLTAFTLNPVLAAGAAGIGSMLADILSGYSIYAPGTLIIKAAMALTASLLFHRLQKKASGETAHHIIKLILSSAAAEIIMVAGYFAYAMIIGNAGSAIASLTGNLIQGGICIVIACIIQPLLSQIAKRY